jgi:hypothetical protein
VEYLLVRGDVRGDASPKRRPRPVSVASTNAMASRPTSGSSGRARIPAVKFDQVEGD